MKAMRGSVVFAAAVLADVVWFIWYTLGLGHKKTHIDSGRTGKSAHGRGGATGAGLNNLVLYHPDYDRRLRYLTEIC